MHAEKRKTERISRMLCLSSLGSPSLLLLHALALPLPSHLALLFPASGASLHGFWISRRYLKLFFMDIFSGRVEDEDRSIAPN